MEIKKLLQLNYEDLIKYLKEKYGEVPNRYFTEKFNKTSGNTRTHDGLFIHHIKEDEMILLSYEPKKHPVVKSGLLSEKQINLIYGEFQENYNLVYCDLLEHAILHIKIIENPNPMINEISVGVGGLLNFMIPELNDIYAGITYQVKWKEEIRKKILHKKNDYLHVLKYLFEKNESLNLEEIFSSYNSKYGNGKWNDQNNEIFYNEIKQFLLHNIE